MPPEYRFPGLLLIRVRRDEQNTAARCDASPGLGGPTVGHGALSLAGQRFHRSHCPATRSAGGSPGADEARSPPCSAAFPSSPVGCTGRVGEGQMSAVVGEIELRADSGFELSLRGYHRVQVDRYIATVQMRLTTAETE